MPNYTAIVPLIIESKLNLKSAAYGGKVSEQKTSTKCALRWAKLPPGWGYRVSFFLLVKEMSFYNLAFRSIFLLSRTRRFRAMRKQITTIGKIWRRRIWFPICGFDFFTGKTISGISNTACRKAYEKSNLVFGNYVCTQSHAFVKANSCGVLLRNSCPPRTSWCKLFLIFR